MGSIGFWLLFGTGVYFMISYKAQSGPSVFLPYSSGDMITFNAALSAIFSLQVGTFFHLSLSAPSIYAHKL